MFKKIFDSLKGAFSKTIKVEYESQRDIAVSPFIKCFPTSMSMELDSAGVKVRPDEIAKYLNNNSFWSWCLINIWKPERFKNKMFVVWKAELEYLRRFLPVKYKPIYNKKTSEEYLIEQLNNNKPIVIQTSPYYQGRRLGHIVIITGYSLVDQVWIIQDPFGSMITAYANSNGKDLRIPFDFMRGVRGKLSLSYTEK